MKLIVNPHKIEIEKELVNELEVNVTKVQFEFDEAIPSNYVKKAFFSNDVASKVVILDSDECDIPNEVLTKIGQVRLGVIAYEVQDEELVERFNPSPVYFYVSEGSMIEADNTEPITPTDKEQIEQMLSNIHLSVNKEGKITTISFTNTDGITQTETLEDGKSIEFNWQGTSLGIRQEGESVYQYVDLKGAKGDPGAIKMVIVNSLPDIGEEDTIYLVPTADPETGNNYDEYVFVNGHWEKLGGVQVQVDLTDYVKFTDYASSNTGGVIKIGTYGTLLLNNKLAAAIDTYADYGFENDNFFISKGTLENVITGKGLITNQVSNLVNYYDKTYIDTTVGDIETLLEVLDIGSGARELE